MKFIGAGQCNVVVDLTPADLAKLIDEIPEGQPRPEMEPLLGAALRLRNATHNECASCFAALQPFVGDRLVVPLTPEFRQAVLQVAPSSCHDRIVSATEATLIPNYTKDPVSLLKGAGSAPQSVRDADGGLPQADYSVEVKPKGAWAPPAVVGIEVDGDVHFLPPVKCQQCRFSIMQSYKAIRDATEGEARSTYCPNFLLRSTASSQEGLRRLAAVPQNNLSVIQCSPARGEARKVSLTPAETDPLAAALDACGVLDRIAKLQLYGTMDTAEQPLPVLDIELLYRWSRAKDPSSVRWRLRPTTVAADAPCGCTTVSQKDSQGATSSSSSSSSSPSSSANTAFSPDQCPASAPLLDFETCVERFYVSTTAKDVSIIAAVSERKEAAGGVPVRMAVCHTPQEDGVQEGFGGVWVDGGYPAGPMYRIGVVDLDTKKHKPLEHYLNHDAKIMDAFAKLKQ